MVTEPAEIDLWLTAEWKEAKQLQDVWMAIIVIVVLILLITMTIESRLLTLEARVIHKDYSGVIAQLYSPGLCGTFNFYAE